MWKDILLEWSPHYMKNTLHDKNFLEWISGKDQIFKRVILGKALIYKNQLILCNCVFPVETNERMSINCYKDPDLI